MDTMLLKKIEEEIKRCRKCGSCQASCPVYFETLDEATSPRGKIVLAEALLTGRLKPTKTLLDRISHCTSCYSCSCSCVNKVNTVEILNFAKNRVYTKRKELSLVNRFVAFIIKNQKATSLTFAFIRKVVTLFKLMPFENINPLSKFPGGDSLSHNEKSSQPEKGSPRFESPQSILFFPGCLSEINEGENVSEILQLLKEQNIDVTIPDGLVCCGAPSYYEGDRKTTLNLVEKNTQTFLSGGRNKCIVTACATCGHILKNVYPKILSGAGKPFVVPQVLDIQEYLFSLPGYLKNVAAPEKTSKKKLRVTYHDPCHLKRGQNISLGPRELLKNLPEIEFIEMEDADRCCGGGGTFTYKYGPLSNDIGERKVQAIKKSGAKIVATACPSCRLQLSNMLRKSGLDIEAIHTVQLIRRILKDRQQENGHTVPKDHPCKKEG